MTNWSVKNPYITKVTECYVLNGEGSKKETCHIVFDLGDSGLEYKVGDAIGVLAENPPLTVDNLIKAAGWDRDQTVTTHNGERSLWQALKSDFEIHRVNKKFVKSLTEKFNSLSGKFNSFVVLTSSNSDLGSLSKDWISSACFANES